MFRVWLEKTGRWLDTFALGRFILRMLHRKFVRFCMVAGLNTAFGYFVYATFIFVGLEYWLAALLGQIISIFFNFITYGSLVFKNGQLRLLPRFLIVYTTTYFCNVGGMKLLKYSFGMSDYYTALVMLVPVGILNFILNKIFVFEHKKARNYEKDKAVAE